MPIVHRTRVTFKTKSKYEPDLYNKFITIFGVIHQVSECFCHVHFKPHHLPRRAFCACRAGIVFLVRRDKFPLI